MLYKTLSIGNQATLDSIYNSLGKTIINVFIDSDNLYINFTDKTALRVFDGGQIFSENRYMVCYDDFEKFSGSKLTNVYVKPIDDVDVTFGDKHESMEMEFETSQGSFTIIHNNFHDGRFGGFSINGEITEPWLPKF